MSEIITNIDNTIYSYRNYILKEDENNLYLNNGYFYELINNDVNTKDATIYNYEQYGNRCGFASALNAFRFFGMKDIDSNGEEISNIIKELGGETEYIFTKSCSDIINYLDNGSCVLLSLCAGDLWNNNLYKGSLNHFVLLIDTYRM